ncbi:MAG: hypothetical protein KJ955_04465 [Nanoarchaeota archaeon]|nr:hypothetical protein [Nanoarchaeota archaeon]
MECRDKCIGRRIGKIIGLGLIGAYAAVMGYVGYKVAHQEPYDYTHYKIEPLPCISPISCYKDASGTFFERCYPDGTRIKFEDYNSDGKLDVITDGYGGWFMAAEPKYNFEKGAWEYIEPHFPEGYLHMFEELRTSVKEEDMPDNFYRSCDCPPYHCPY